MTNKIISIDTRKHELIDSVLARVSSDIKSGKYVQALIIYEDSEEEKTGIIGLTNKPNQSTLNTLGLIDEAKALLRRWHWGEE